MESPPSYSTEAPVLSEDSGLIITSGSFSSDSASGWPQITSETQESDCDERSLSLCDSARGSEHMCGENFNTVKKGPGKILTTPIEPPLQFQDSPILSRKLVDAVTKHCSVELPSEHTTLDVACSVRTDSPLYSRSFRCEHIYEKRQRYSSPRQILHLSPCHTARPASRSSLSSRLSSSHNSITTQLQVDDSSYITQAISHDTLSANTSDIADMYNVPFDSDIYAVPVDTIKPSQAGRHKGKKNPKSHRKRVRSAGQPTPAPFASSRHTHISRPCARITEAAQESGLKRYSLPGTSGGKACSMQLLKEEPSHMSLNEVRQYLHVLCTSSSDSLNTREDMPIEMFRYLSFNNNNSIKVTENIETSIKSTVETNNNEKNASKKNPFSLNLRVKKNKEHKSKELLVDEPFKKSEPKTNKLKTSPVRNISFNIRQTFCNLFRTKRRVTEGTTKCEQIAHRMAMAAPPLPLLRRALPPLPQTPPSKPRVNDDGIIDFATSIEKVKDYGWYWGPISVEAAEKILSTEPDGSFIVRDSSDDHYIFTLTFKLNGMRHVRIEHEQGNFCFGGCAMFKAHTIVEFIENAVETSRSGRYLFFLNLRPVLGPVRVQLLYPVSRFKRVQSLQHMCRFVILKVVRRDLINSLPLPRRMLDYLNSTHYYAELLADS